MEKPPRPDGAESTDVSLLPDKPADTQSALTPSGTPHGNEQYKDVHGRLTKSLKRDVEAWLAGVPSFEGLEAKEDLEARQIEDNMSETDMLRLHPSALPGDERSITHRLEQPPTLFPKAYQSDLITRNPWEVKIDVSVQVIHKGQITFAFARPAAMCRSLSDLRTQVIIVAYNGQLRTATTWATYELLLSSIKDSRKTSFRLEEDGHAAPMTMAPTRITALNVFPYYEYEAWYFRNVLRGTKKEYMVEVTIDV